MATMPLDVWRVVLSYDECRGRWLGLRLMMVARTFFPVVCWAAFNTEPGKEWCARFVRLYIVDPRTVVPSWLVNRSFLWVFASSRYISLLDRVEAAERAVENDDFAFLSCVYDVDSADESAKALRQFFIRFAVAQRAERVMMALLRCEEDVRTALVEAVALNVDMFDTVTLVHTEPAALITALRDCVMGVPPTGLDAATMHDVAAAACRADAPVVLTALLKAGYVMADELISELKQRCTEAVAGMRNGVAWLSSVDRWGKSLKWLSRPQALEYMTRAHPAASHLFEVAAGHPDAAVFEWALERWPPRRLTQILAAVEHGAESGSGHRIVARYGPSLTSASWSAALESFMHLGDANFLAFAAQFGTFIGTKAVWQRVHARALSVCLAAVGWAAERDLLCRRKCAMLVASVVRPLPAPVLDKVRGQKLVAKALLHAISCAHVDAAVWLLDNTVWSSAALLRRRDALVRMAITSGRRDVLLWVARRFPHRYTDEARRRLIDEQFRLTMDLQHAILFEL